MIHLAYILATNEKFYNYTKPDAVMNISTLFIPPAAELVKH